MNIKSAICLYGIVGGTEGKDGLGVNIPFEECYKTYKRHIINVNKADVFVHSWSVEAESDLINLYKPKKYQFQPQIQFDYKHPPIHKGEKALAKHKDQGFRSLSKWYSLKRSLELKTEYELEHNFEYDAVMLTRFDTLFFVDLDFSKCDLSCLCVPNWNTPDGLGEHPKIKPDRVNRSETGYGLSDMWYLSNSKIINEFIGIYDGVKSNKYRVSQHKAAWDCFLDIGYQRNILKYYLYRHYDFELYRWHVLRNFYKKGDGWKGGNDPTKS
jgi:hypothetical protein